METEVIENDYLIRRSFQYSGALQLETRMKDGRKDGVQKLFDNYGRISIVSVYRDGIEIEKSLFSYVSYNWCPFLKRTYRNNKLTIEYEYDDKGEIIKTTSYT